MIAGGLVATYGLRACPRRCAGRCSLASVKGDGRIVPSDACELMRGPPPTPGTMPPLTWHDEGQLRAMAEDERGDRDVGRAAVAELQRRGGR